MPKSFDSATVTYTLTFHSTIDLDDVIISVNDTSTLPGYYHFVINPQAVGLRPGEWEYTLTTNYQTVASGMVWVCTSVLGYRKIYDKNITYGQYSNDDGE